VIITGFCLSIINQSKDKFVVGYALLSRFDYYTKIPVSININFRILDIGGALGVLIWNKSLFEYIYNYLFL